MQSITLIFKTNDFEEYCCMHSKAHITRGVI